MSSLDQKDDLERQQLMLQLYGAKPSCTFEAVTDLGAGMNHRKKGLRKLPAQIVDGPARRLLTTP